MSRNNISSLFCEMKQTTAFVLFLTISLSKADLKLKEHRQMMILNEVQNYPSSYIPRERFKGEISSCDFLFYDFNGFIMSNSPNIQMKQNQLTLDGVKIFEDDYTWRSWQSENYPRYRHLYAEVPHHNSYILHDSSKVQYV